MIDYTFARVPQEWSEKPLTSIGRYNTAVDLSQSQVELGI